MDLPTYTSIWRIEKRLYKLYDFRLPMPLPIGQITVFAAITVPFVMLLTVSGVPFNHTLVWLYVLPPAALTWLVTRPVVESKRLPELVTSQLRYLTEPKAWCRMAPLAERDAVLLNARVWRIPSRGPGRPARARSAPAFGRPILPLPHLQQSPQPARARQSQEPQLPQRSLPARQQPLQSQRAPQPQRLPRTQLPPRSPRDDLELLNPRRAESSRSSASPTPTQPARVTVVATGVGEAPPAVERVLAGPSARSGDARPTTRVSVIPGGYRPGRPDQTQRDLARAQLAIGGPARVVVLGCTVGAGQTTTALITGDVLAGAREDGVAVLDLNPGPGSLAQRALARPAVSQAASLGPSRLVVLGVGPGEPDAGAADLADATEQLELAGVGHGMVLADPSTASLPRLLQLVDQLILVAPASAAAASAIAMTFEWLEAHGQARLASEAVMVVNGVSRRSMQHVEQAERVAVGRCRAIVRVPWDDQLTPTRGASRTRQTAAAAGQGQQWTGVLGSATVTAYTALAGVLVAALAGREQAAR